MHARCCQTQTGRLKTSEELELGPVEATNDNEGDMPSWSPTETTLRRSLKKGRPEEEASPAQEE